MLFRSTSSAPAPFATLLAAISDPSAREQTTVLRGDARLIAAIADPIPSA